VARRAHAIRLLGTLLSICRQLQKLQPNRAARAACREVEQHLETIQETYRT
jgi:hypothetical protein